MTGVSISLGDSERGHLDDDAHWAGAAAVRGPSWARMPLITVGTLGMQIVWSVEMGYASPYLISLGLSKSLMSLVFVAGPLSGLIMQPLVGAYSDRCKSRFGRRRPYLVAGTLISTIALLLLGYIKQIASIFGFGDALRDKITIFLAVFSIYLIDFSVNAVMATSRALLVDTLSTEEQDVGNAWAGRMSGLGSIAGFFVGNIRLPALFPLLGKTQLQVLSVLTGVLLVITNGITTAAVGERVLLEASGNKRNNESGMSILSTVKDIWVNMRTLPEVILRICIIQFLSWIGWFPILFYTTLWVSDIYTRTVPRDFDGDEAAVEAGTRAGNRALLYSSLVAMVAFVVLPFIASSSTNDSAASRGKTSKRSWEMHVATLWSLSNAVFACSMASTWFIDSVWGANCIIGATGFSWAVSLWAPFALLGEQIHASHSHSTYALARVSEDIPLHDRRSSRNASIPAPISITAVGEEVVFHSGELSARASRTNLTDDGEEPDHNYNGQRSASAVHVDVHDQDDEDYGPQQEGRSVGDKAGVILGIHNVFVVIPQFIVTGISSIIFALFEPERSVVNANHSGESTPAPLFNGTLNAVTLRHSPLTVRDESATIETRDFDSIGFMFRLGGFCAAAACILCWRLSRQLQRP